MPNVTVTETRTVDLSHAYQAGSSQTFCHYTVNGQRMLAIRFYRTDMRQETGKVEIYTVAPHSHSDNSGSDFLRYLDIRRPGHLAPVLHAILVSEAALPEETAARYAAIELR